MNSNQRLAIVMAGGSSPMLWPQSTMELPKQFLHFIGDGTLLQNTIERVAKIFSPEDIFVVTTENFFEITKEQIPQIPVENIILEPFARQTLPCVSLALTSLHRKFSDDSIVVVFPSDHYIPNFRDFQDAIETAMDFAAVRDAIVTIGVPQTKPETNYGYIQVNDSMEDLGEFYYRGVRYIQTFVEKPDLETAKRFLETGEFLWNTGIYVWKASSFWNALRTCSFETYNYFQTLKKLVGYPSFKDGVVEIYQQIKSQSLDFGIIEPSRNVFVVSASFVWSDVGCWDEFFQLAQKDLNENYILGNVYTIDVNNSIIISNTKPIAAIEVDDIILIESEKAILVCKRGRSYRVEEIVNLLKRKNAISLL
ncbi:MAG: mannose-1-phosphate guanylyltransferase [Candidatus Kapaibacteriales bacterium]